MRGLNECPSSLDSYLSLGESGADYRHVTAAKRGTAVGLPLRVFLHLFAVHRQRTATQTVSSAQARHTRVAQLVSLEIMDGTYESIYLVAFILAGPVYNNALKNRAARVCRACVDLITCVADRYLTLRTGYEKHGRKNPLPFLVFAAITCR